MSNALINMATKETPDPDLSGEANWQPLVVPALLTNPNSFISGDPEGKRLRLRYFFNPEDDNIIAKTWFGPAAEGPPKHAHGGSIASVLDEAMGMAALYAGHTVVAANISINYIKMVPLESVALAITRVAEVEGKKVHTEAKLTGPNGLVYATGKGLFIAIGFNKIAALAK